MIVGFALAAAATPLPATTVEAYYADWFYPALQSRLTRWSNESAISLFDVLIAFVALTLVVMWCRWARGVWRGRTFRPLIRGAWITAIVASTMYLWFLVAWGFNYARPSVETVVGYEPSRVTLEAVRALAVRALTEVNRHHAAAHAAGFPANGEIPPLLVAAARRVGRQLGQPAEVVPTRPKKTLLGVFFRAAGVDGMHAPFLLETLLNPDLTPPERPAVLAHEWAHLAGYAPEDEASFVGFLSALEADVPSQYSAWLALFDETVRQLPRLDQRDLVSRLEAGPRADRAAIRQRLTARVELISRASWTTYDQYLKAQGVREGIQSYSRAVQLLLGSGLIDKKGSGLLQESAYPPEKGSGVMQQTAYSTRRPTPPGPR